MASSSSLTCLSNLFSPTPLFSLSHKPSLLSLKLKLPFTRPTFIALVAQTSDWAHQDGEESDSQLVFDWDQDQQQLSEGEDEGPQAGLPDWDTEGDANDQSKSEGSAVDVEADGGLVADDDDDDYPLPPEEAKLFVGNIPYTMESADLAELFNRAGVVETAESRNGSKSRFWIRDHVYSGGGRESFGDVSSLSDYELYGQG